MVMVTEDKDDSAMEQAEAPEPADSSTALGDAPGASDEERQHQAEQHLRLFGSASTAEDAPAADDEPDESSPPAVLNDEQKEQLIAAIDEMRRSTKNVNRRYLGWKLEFNLRKQPGSSTRGDMMVIDPADGQKLFSVVSVKRKLGMPAPSAAARALPCQPHAPQAATLSVGGGNPATPRTGGHAPAREQARESSAADGGGDAAVLPARRGGGSSSHDWGQVSGGQLLEGS